MTIQELIAKYGITASVEREQSRPDSLDRIRGQGRDTFWRWCVRCQGRELSGLLSRIGDDPPTCAEIIDFLATAGLAGDQAQTLLGPEAWQEALDCPYLGQSEKIPK